MRRCLILLGCVGTCLASGRADDLTVLKPQTGQPAPAEMMRNYLGVLAHEAFDRRAAAWEKLETPEQLTTYQEQMRAFFIAQLGGFPQRTPLNAKVVGELDRDGYRVEKIIYESQPGFPVTAVLYLPLGQPPGREELPRQLAELLFDGVGRREPSGSDR